MRAKDYIHVLACSPPPEHSSEVLGTVDRANKEVAIEALLNTFEEVWLSRQLELVATRRQPLTISRQEVHSTAHSVLYCSVHIIFTSKASLCLHLLSLVGECYVHHVPNT